jgi:hypothetical protein
MRTTALRDEARTFNFVAFASVRRRPVVFGPLGGDGERGAFDVVPQRDRRCLDTDPQVGAESPRGWAADLR